MEEIEWYFDWQFWSSIVAFVALGLSQCPPLRVLLRKGKLTLEKYGMMYVYHGTGCPQTNFFLIFKNEGGKTINIHSMEMIVNRKDANGFVLKGTGYLVNQSDFNFVMLAPFDLASGDVWAHTIHFNEVWDRSTQRKYKYLHAKIRDTITEKNKNTPPELGKLNTANEEDIKSIEEFCNTQFKWEDGEYEMQILVKDKNNNILVSDSSRFTLFESDTDDLKAWAEDYKYGNSVHLPASPKQVGVWVNMSE
ncbi:hypothetical protein AB6E79_23315 [Vibrio lentus]